MLLRKIYSGPDTECRPCASGIATPSCFWRANHIAGLRPWPPTLRSCFFVFCAFRRVTISHVDDETTVVFDDRARHLPHRNAVRGGRRLCAVGVTVGRGNPGRAIQGRWVLDSHGEFVAWLLSSCTHQTYSSVIQQYVLTLCASAAAWRFNYWRTHARSKEGREGRGAGRGSE